MWLAQFDDGLVRILLAVAVVSSALSASEIWTAAMTTTTHAATTETTETTSTLKTLLEPAVIIAILAVNASMGVWQELSAAGSLDALERMQPRLATVLRRRGRGRDDGIRGDDDDVDDDDVDDDVDNDDKGWSVGHNAADLVPGDVIRLRAGDRIPTDSLLASFHRLSYVGVDKSSLMGESNSAIKVPVVRAGEGRGGGGGEGEGGGSYPLSRILPIHDQRSMLFSGTMMTSGSAISVVVRTGRNTQMGKISSGMEDADRYDDDESGSGGRDRKTPLGERLDEFGDVLSKIIGTICVAVWICSVPRFSDPGFDSVLEGAVYYAK